VLAAVALAALGLGSGPALHDRPLEWAVAGVGEGARTLVIQPGIGGGCDEGRPRVAVREGRGRIRVSVTIRSAEGPDVACPAIAHYHEPVTVRLDAPVAGRAIGGPQRSGRPGFVLDSRPPQPGPTVAVPRVAGLRAADARRALCAWRIRARGATGAATVAVQRPRAGRPVTIPREAAPERCSGLPARPAVTLRPR